MDSSENEDESVRLHLSWLLVGVWHEAAHKVGLTVVKSRLRKDDRARFRHKEVFGQSAKYYRIFLKKMFVQISDLKGVWAKRKKLKGCLRKVQGSNIKKM